MKAEVAGLIAELESRQARRVERERRVTRQDHPRASSIGECAREIYHQIVDWRSRPKPSAELIARFQRGNEVERLVITNLIAEGWDVLEQQLPFEITEKAHTGSGISIAGTPFEIPGVDHVKDVIICTGHADLRLSWNGMKPVGEIKSLNPNVWQRVNSIEDFKRMGSFWTRYLYQLPLYCYAHDEPLGLFILDDCLGHRKFIPMVLEEHLDECEAALQKCRAAAIGSLTGKAPDHCGNATVCMKCWCREVGVCAPPLDFGDDGVHVIDDPSLPESLERMEELRDDAAEYEALDKAIKARIKATGPGDYLAGDWIIRAKAQARTVYKVPDEVKKQYAETSEAIRTTWSRIKDASPTA